jgi:hypothetical protein
MTVNWGKRFSSRRCQCGKEFSPKGTRDIWCSVECRFWSHVDKSAGPDQCWPWKKGCYCTGYGQFTVKGKHLYAHRVALQLSGIEIPEDHYGIHECDNPPCCNPHPKHVIVGTPQKNSLDAHRRGRRDNVNYATGDRHGARKMKLLQREATS